MASSIIAICNSAAYKVGTEPFLSLKDGTKMSDYCDNRYDDVRKTLIRKHPWSFAKIRATISPTTTIPDFYYTNEFTIPADSLRLFNDGSLYDEEYDINGRRILSNSATLQLVYLRDEKDPIKFDDLFSEALALYMAWDSSFHITKSRSLKKQLGEEFKQMMSSAATVNAQEQMPQTLESDLWLDSRETGHFVPNI